MVDDTIETTTVSPIKPVEPKPAPVPEPIKAAEPEVHVLPPEHEPAPEPTAKEMLRKFEDEHFGENASRINGEVERGIGSPYAGMAPHQKAHYAALEQMVRAEKGMADASAALAAAQAAHEAALTAVETAADEPA